MANLERADDVGILLSREVQLRLQLRNSTAGELRAK
jgi:hypothetical protein